MIRAQFRVLMRAAGVPKEQLLPNPSPGRKRAFMTVHGCRVGFISTALIVTNGDTAFVAKLAACTEGNIPVYDRLTSDRTRAITGSMLCTPVPETRYREVETDLASLGLADASDEM